jgi:hypothetical protein
VRFTDPDSRVVGPVSETIPKPAEALRWGWRGRGLHARHQMCCDFEQWSHDSGAELTERLVNMIGYELGDSETET